MNWNKLFSQSTNAMKESLIRELVALTKGVKGMISFAGGFPAEATLPSEQLSEIFSESIKNFGNDILQYGASGGDLFLKKQIKKWEGIEDYSDNQILISTGSTNAIYYFTKTFIDKGDVIISEGPSFLGTLVAFEAEGAIVEGVKMDSEGMIMTELKQKIASLKKEGKKIKFIYTIPEFQNPTGITMSLKRREELIQIAIENEIPILEDNPYEELRLTGNKIPDLYKIARDKFSNKEIVTTVKSFSKTLGPGLRLAYAFGAEKIIGEMISWTQKINVSADCVTQRAVSNFLEKDMFRPHITGIRKFYQPKLNLMLEELEKNMPSEVKWTHPEGGMFVWVYLPENLNADELFNKAIENKVAFIPGSKFYPSNQEVYHELRLNFSYPSLEEIRVGIKRLAEIIKKELN